MGLVAMHGLGPAPVGQHARAMPMASSHNGEAASVGSRVAHVSEAACHHGSGTKDRGHVGHADPTCAASGISSAPTLTAATLNVADCASPASFQASGCDAATAVERAPPSLANLQLLRI
ncbi:DUF6153 family protein [Streptomyces winkii]|uniref:DUF6153 family protein n=1 Tax=Streptomyces winkii TaxID=3051178 RepID=UPI0028D016EC|nr:DUF6153 family protein [Streptomyces sp. DSM 40971]